MKLPSTHKFAGVLSPVFALRTEGDMGIGDTQAVMELIDWARDCGLKLVKLLPINETGKDHSPYNAISCRALEPTTLHLAPESVPGLTKAHLQDVLSRHFAEEDKGSSRVEYDRIKPLKKALMEEAFHSFRHDAALGNFELADAFASFMSKESDWLESYSIFRSLMERNDDSEIWNEWPAEHQSPEAAARWYAGLSAEEQVHFTGRISFFCFVQWVAFRQWSAVRLHAEQAGVALMGDIPFGVSRHSADVWAAPHLFRAGWFGGAPPERYFKHDTFVQKWGQNWGIPLYNWDERPTEVAAWWCQRVLGMQEFFDHFRIDHILGFFRIYGFPWPPECNAEFLPLSREECLRRTGGSLPGFQPRSDDTDANRSLNCTEGHSRLASILHIAGTGTLIGEDLGEIPDYVPDCLRELGIAGYKVPQWQRLPDGSLLDGASYERLSVATYGTHDHEPMRAMWDGLSREAAHDLDAAGAFQALLNFAGISTAAGGEYTHAVHESMMRALLQTNSWLAVFMITDVFARTERFNLPGVAAKDNWTLRMHSPISALRSSPESALLARLVADTRGRQLETITHNTSDAEVL